MNVSITDIMVDDDITKFTIKNTNVSVVNALRRIILTDIPACVIQTDSEAVNQCKIEINTGDSTTSFEAAVELYPYTSTTTT
jgi:hypothetical protein